MKPLDNVIFSRKAEGNAAWQTQHLDNQIMSYNLVISKKELNDYWNTQYMN